MDIIQLIEEIEDLVDDAQSVPFSKKVMIEPDEIYEILKEMRTSLPEEIKQANWINDEKDRIISEAQSEADQEKAEARKEIERANDEAHQRYASLVNEHEITKEATRIGEEIVAKAEQNARTLKMQSITYVDEMLGQTQDSLKHLLTILEDNRNELK